MFFSSLFIASIFGGNYQKYWKILNELSHFVLKAFRPNELAKHDRKRFRSAFFKKIHEKGVLIKPMANRLSST